jgi:hypothetical protein
MVEEPEMTPKPTVCACFTFFTWLRHQHAELLQNSGREQRVWADSAQAALLTACCAKRSMASAPAL